MRFIAGGPWLPDELLTARDAGQVIFFCGAGVSQADAWLPNFASLAERVLASLGSALDSTARRLFDASHDFEKASGLTGLVATDRIFGLLEREFDPREVREAVAKALRPPEGYGLGAHGTMLDLSRDRAGVARLVTTNFDRLFEECDPSLGSFNPPHLPDPRREKDFRGIIHIHGRVDLDYTRACDDEFVLSSADFGRAYLSDGWATRYIQTLLQRYKIVFVGYSADDPPVQYLLEALSRADERPNGLYAFQAGNIAEASAQWAHKGVLPIPYDDADEHLALWNTLRAWADRARDVDAWYDDVIAEARVGPAELMPHQRGMIAHLASTREGTRRLAASTTPTPATWLCVFDHNRRYGDPGPANFYDEASTRFDPFSAFGLDSDEAPAATDPDDRFSRRETPEGAWDGFASTEADRERLPIDGVGWLRGRGAGAPPKLPARLWHLGMFLIRVAEQPAALWWAAHQSGLHPDVAHHLEWSIRQQPDRYSPLMLRGWRLLLASWRERAPDPNSLRYELEALVQQEGWSTKLARAVVEMYRPVLAVKPPLGTIAPANDANIELNQILRADVDYPRPHKPLVIPPEHMPYAVALFRSQIEYALVLEREVDGHDRVHFDTTRADDGEELDEDGFRLTGHLATFINMMTRLAVADPAAAKAEFDNWPANANQVFTRLRIWAAGQKILLSADDAARVFLTLDEECFWTAQHERDLLFALRDRWTDMSAGDREQIELRLRTGSYPWPEPRDDMAKANAHYRLNRLQWLHDHGVQFGFDQDAELVKNREHAPDWEPRFAEHAAQPKVRPVRRIETVIDPEPLLNVPIGRILAAAREASQFDFSASVEHRPFRGLAESHPSRALAALTDATRKGEFDESSWSAMLHATSRSELKPRMICAISRRLSRLTPEQVALLIHPISEWLRDLAATLIETMPELFELVWNTLAAAMAAHPPKPRFRRADEGWVDDGLNQPAGRMVGALFEDPVKNKFYAGGGLSPDWSRRLDQLLGLPGDARRHAIAMISPHLNWLYNVDPEWAESRLVTLADGEGPDSQAFWGGYFWAARTPQLPLYTRLKGAFIALARAGGRRRDYSNKLAGMLLAGWAGDDNGADPNALIPDVELREILIHADDELRVQTLWYLERWSHEAGSIWGDRLLPFLRNVWPRQSSVKTARTSGRLVDLAISFPDRFPELVEAILPRLAPIKGASVRIGPFLDVESGIATQHPNPLLDLLWTALPEDPQTWPYETGKMLGVLADQDATKADPRLLELRRREQQR